MLEYLINRYAWRGWQLALLRISMVCLGILMGCHFPEFFKSVNGSLWIAFAVTSFFTIVWGFRARPLAK